jgi:mono/diheme cytochrome c family protein
MWCMTFRKRRGHSLLSCAALLLASCTQRMADQPRYDPLQKSTFFADMLSARPLPEGTVPRSMHEPDELLDLGLINGQPADRFPFALTMDVLSRGRERYDIYCAPCHDYVGTGNGMAARRGFRRQPASFHTEQLRTAPHGHFFDVISNGFGEMPSYATAIDPRDRWAIIAYVRALQRSQWATIEDVPQEEVQKLQSEKR